MHEYRRTDYPAAFARAVAQGHHPYALRLLGKYGADSLELGRALIQEAPRTGDPAWDTMLAAVTRWAAARTGTPVPPWAADWPASPRPLFPAERYREISEAMKERTRDGTPAELAAMNVWVRERDLWPVRFLRSGPHTPEQEARAQATEDSWTALEGEFGLLEGREAAAVLGPGATPADVAALRAGGKLLAVRRGGEHRYPGFQFGVDGQVLPLMGRLASLAGEYDVDEESVLLWLTAPSTWFQGRPRPVDHLTDPDAVYAAFAGHYGTIW